MTTNGDARLEMPYVGGGDPFEIRVDATKKKNSRYSLFAKGGAFSKALESNLWDSTKATYKRMCIVVCSSEANSITTRLGELKADLLKSPWKAGLLAVCVSDANEYAMYQSRIKEIALGDETNRLVVALMKEPCTNELLEQWYAAITHKELSAEESKRASANTYEAQAAALISQWVAVTSNEQILACYGDVQFPSLYGQSDLIKRVENDVLYKVFYAAPERIVISHTAFRPCNG